MLGYLELYRTALYGLHVCQDGLVGKLRSYNSAVRAKDVERVRKIARDIEVLHQNQHQFFKVFGVQSHFILNNTSQDKNPDDKKDYVLGNQFFTSNPFKSLKISKLHSPCLGMPEQIKMSISKQRNAKQIP